MQFIEGITLKRASLPKEKISVITVRLSLSLSLSLSFYLHVYLYLIFIFPFLLIQRVNSLQQEQVANFYAALKSFSFLPTNAGIGSFEELTLHSNVDLTVDAIFQSQYEGVPGPFHSFKEWFLAILHSRILHFSLVPILLFFLKPK